MAQIDIPGFTADSVLIDLTGDESETSTDLEVHELPPMEPYIKQEPTNEPTLIAHTSTRDDLQPKITSDSTDEITKISSDTEDEQPTLTSKKDPDSFTISRVDITDQPDPVATPQQQEEGALFDTDPFVQDDMDMAMDIANLEALRLYNENKTNLPVQHEDTSASAYQERPCPESGDDLDMQLWDAGEDADPSFEHEEALAAFARRKEEYERKVSLGITTEVDDIQFAADKAAEQNRLRDFERSQMVVADPPELPPGYVEEESLFIPEQSRPPDVSFRKRAAPKPKNRINKQEMLEAMAAGIDNGFTKGGKPKRKATEASDDHQPKRGRTSKAAGGVKPARRQPRKRKAPMLSNVSSLGRTNIVQAAQANALRPDMPTFTARDKSKALRELIASIPLADGGSHNSDKKAILDATKKFRGKGAIRSDGQGAWRHKDMESSLYNHQLLGVAFLRDRENSDSKPRGGLVCDEMGFGKTIQMIANILDGKPDENSPCKTTLIVAPPTLLTQWMFEMDKHVKGGKLGRILRYHSGARLVSNDIQADLCAYDIILTTYGEVQKSYPVPDPPKHLSSEAKKNEWWAKFFKENVGPLHQIKYHRVVLDEAHLIKNHTSKTSIAVCALTGVYKWCITGTPIMNYIEELYPYFRFLRVPHTGDYGTFCHNFCNSRMSREPINMERIHNILRAIMLRRTHVDTMFNAPVVKLPGITHTTHLVEFNEVERAIYNMVKTRYIFQINSYSRSGGLTANYRNILSMMLRLRMLCSHILLCQDVLKQMFVAADIESLWRLTAKEVRAAGDENQKNLIGTLRNMLQVKANTVPTCQTRDAEVDATAVDLTAPSVTTATQEVATQEVEAAGATGRSFGLSFKFRKFLRSLSESKTWSELHDRSTCGKCRLPPDDPVCTSCFHVYCKECINAMEYECQARSEEGCACLECGALFEETSPCSGLKELGFNSDAVTQRIEETKKRARRSSSGGKGGRGKKNNRSNSVPAAGDDNDEEDKDPDWIELMGTTVLPSAKLTATKAAILNWQQTAKGEKIIIYTQFLGLCRILGKVCSAEGWGHVEFNGKMSFEAREKSIERFRDDPAVFIMICSLKAGGVGLNLSMASKVIILDLWFNSSIEAQAYCRAFRIGQQRKVEVLRFVVKDTIDEDLIKMQDRKDVEVTGAIGPESHGKRATIQQLLELFGEVREESQNEFILIEDDDQNDNDDANLPLAERLPPRPF
ncbi:hypothetical protein A1O3_00468 [Capronia epimyces CBS 606.96]|uniref:Adenosinetriphosphatase n=1 Tax=Capronia epimyces CBS 606.96 TaxID=1182542 RepID=W9YHB5_9EURO|nr:uncharacterized protein A1O3_00468 [Capronia epimyces CBS 606.96]EXJ91918.1 hypothetical protein A1O3_00468 [Capronia epimyces CBS 606.96]